MTFDRFVTGVHVIVSAPQQHQRTQFLERLGRIVHAQIETRVIPRPPGGLAVYDDQRCGLPAAGIAACSLRCFQCRPHSFRKVPFSFFKRLCHCRPHPVLRHQIHLYVDRERRSRKYGPVAPAPTPSSLTIGRMPVVSWFTSKQNESNVWIFGFRGESSTSIPTMFHRPRRLLCPRTRAATQSPESRPLSHPLKFPKIFSATKPR